MVPRLKKLKPEEIDWLRVRKIARLSYTTGPQPDADFEYMQAVWRSDPERYVEEIQAVRAAERRKISTF